MKNPPDDAFKKRQEWLDAKETPKGGLHPATPLMAGMVSFDEKEEETVKIIPWHLQGKVTSGMIDAGMSAESPPEIVAIFGEAPYRQRRYSKDELLAMISHVADRQKFRDYVVPMFAFRPDKLDAMEIPWLKWGKETV